MKNAWKIPGKASTLNPPPFTAGEPSLLLPDPPDPLDPALPLSPIQFPPLSSATPTGSKSNSSRKSGALDLEGPAATETVPSGSSNTGSIGSETTTNPATVLDSQSENPNNKFTILQPKFSSPLQTNKASSLPVQKPLETPVTPNPSIEVDLTKPLPSVMEFERQSGEVVEVLVHYLWVPPTCSPCHELGHIVRNCLSYIPPPPADPPGNQSKAQGKRPLVADQTSSQKPSQKPTQSPSQTPSQMPRKIHQKKKSSSIIPTQQYVPVIGNKFSQLAQESNSGSSLILPASSPMQVDNPISSASTVNSPPCFSPEPNPRPSLKRCRSSPTLSPPPSSHPNPFAPLSSTNCQATIDSTLSLQTFLSITPYPKNTSAPIQTTSLNTSTPISQDSTSQLANHSSFSLTRESISHGGDPPTLN
ncbi:hypothetical protein DY000_02006309 [Brassica cretica]|uniref:CCHC-type domain-containing protein n=1 Tax=Brassica cretica TaxID=69181 RepID=A0ABQ7C5Z1_BRACR|nr:hypothetical protein DY000_02006309 [Brassica cretica]